MDSLKTLLAIMAELRHPERGCPWDKEQDFTTIAPFTIEEAYEVADAIDRNDMEDLRDELGDLLFQVVYHTRLASEKGAFKFQDVVDSITGKILRRHPHVFGDAKVDSPEHQSRLWERAKRDEAGEKGSGTPTSVLRDIPVALPALQRAQKIQSRVATVGFDWDNIPPVLEKIREELGELESEIASSADKDRLTEELGDLIFSCVNLARHMGINAETALRATNREFINRFQYMEAKIEANGDEIDSVDSGELERLWQEAKQKVLSRK